MSSKPRLLPAVMLTTALSGAALSGTALARVAPQDPVTPRADTPPQTAGVTPAVMKKLPPGTYPVPESLSRYTKEKFEQVAMMRWWPWDEDPDPTHCATISGSDRGWDDSDCM